MVGGALVLGIGLLGGWLIRTRHVPYDIPAAARPPASWSQPGPGLTLRSLGIAGFEVSDGVTTVLLDPTVTRPDPLALISGPIEADPALGERWCPRADLILVDHAHYDHSLDVGAIARRTGALVVGSQNVVNLAQSRGVPAERTRLTHSGDRFTVGAFTIDVRASRHADTPFSKERADPIPVDAGPLRFWQHRLDEVYAYRLSAHGVTLWFHPTSTFEPGELGGLRADTLISGVTGEPLTHERVSALLGEAGARRVLPTHFDNFFQPLSLGLALMPTVDLDAARALYLAVDPTIEWGVLDYDQQITLPPDGG